MKSRMASLMGAFEIEEKVGPRWKNVIGTFSYTKEDALAKYEKIKNARQTLKYRGWSVRFPSKTGENLIHQFGISPQKFLKNVIDGIIRDSLTKQKKGLLCVEN